MNLKRMSTVVLVASIAGLGTWLAGRLHEPRNETARVGATVAISGALGRYERRTAFTAQVVVSERFT